MTDNARRDENYNFGLSFKEYIDIINDKFNDVYSALSFCSDKTNTHHSAFALQEKNAFVATTTVEVVSICDRFKNLSQKEAFVRALDIPFSQALNAYHVAATLIAEDIESALERYKRVESKREKWTELHNCPKRRSLEEKFTRLARDVVKVADHNYNSNTNHFLDNWRASSFEKIEEKIVLLCILLKDINDFCAAHEKARSERLRTRIAIAGCCIAILSLITGTSIALYINRDKIQETTETSK